jgi:hypothetical protein
MLPATGQSSGVDTSRVIGCDVWLKIEDFEIRREAPYTGAMAVSRRFFLERLAPAGRVGVAGCQRLEIHQRPGAAELNDAE